MLVAGCKDSRPAVPTALRPLPMQLCCPPIKQVYLPHSKPGPASCPALTVRMREGLPYELQTSEAAATPLPLGAPRAAAPQAIGLASWRAKDHRRGPSTTTPATLAADREQARGGSFTATVLGRLPSWSPQRHQWQGTWLSGGEEASPGPCRCPAWPTSTCSPHGVSHTHLRACRGLNCPRNNVPSPNPQYL